MKRSPFAVKADSFELYERFVKECEGIGWKEDKSISNWDIGKFNNGFILAFAHERLRQNTFTHFAWDVSGDNFDVYTIYQLETQYPEAIAAAKAWFEGEEVKPAEDKYKALHETMSKEAERLQSLLTAANIELSELKTQVKLLLKHNRDQHDRNNAKLMAVSILLSSSMAPDNFSVDCIKQHIDELIEKEYDEPGALPF